MAERHNLDYMRLDEIQSAASNPKTHDLPGIIRSIAELGITDTIGVLDDRTGRLISGHGRREALLSLHRDGRPLPKGVDEDEDGMWLVPVLRGWASKNDAEAAAALLNSNRLSAKAGNDDRELVKLLNMLEDSSMLGLAGYDLDYLDDLNAALQETAPPPPTYRPSELGEARDYDEDDETDGNMRRTRGLDDLKDDYEASNVRVLVLSYPGDRYVWAVQQLAGLSARYGVENNSDAVLRVIAEVTGETPPDA